MMGYFLPYILRKNPAKIIKLKEDDEVNFNCVHSTAHTHTLYNLCLTDSILNLNSILCKHFFFVLVLWNIILYIANIKGRNFFVEKFYHFCIVDHGILIIEWRRFLG